jgi:hypothetical protein
MAGKCPSRSLASGFQPVLRGQQGSKDVALTSGDDESSPDAAFFPRQGFYLRHALGYSGIIA